MLTRIAIATVAISALGAGAFAFSPERQATDSKPAAITVIEKNQHWPLKGYITMAPCERVACQEV